MNRHGRASSVRVPKLLVGATLPDLYEAQTLENSNDLAGLQDHPKSLGDSDRLGPHKFGTETRIAVFQKHGNHLFQVGV